MDGSGLRWNVFAARFFALVAKKCRSASESRTACKLDCRFARVGFSTNSKPFKLYTIDLDDDAVEVKLEH